MKIKRFGVALLACVMCFGAFSTTAFAYVDAGRIEKGALPDGRGKEA